MPPASTGLVVTIVMTDKSALVQMGEKAQESLFAHDFLSPDLCKGHWWQKVILRFQINLLHTLLDNGVPAFSSFSVQSREWLLIAGQE